MLVVGRSFPGVPSSGLTNMTEREIVRRDQPRRIERSGFSRLTFLNFSRQFGPVQRSSSKYEKTKLAQSPDLHSDRNG